MDQLMCRCFPNKVDTRHSADKPYMTLVLWRPFNVNKAVGSTNVPAWVIGDNVKKVCFYIAQYPVRWPLKVLYTFPPCTDLFILTQLESEKNENVSAFF